MSEIEFLSGVDPQYVLQRLGKAAGKEIQSGKLLSAQSSSALAVNTFGWFAHRPHLLPAFPGIVFDAPPTAVDVEYCARFPWRGGMHPWLDAAVETPGNLIGVESKRFEPFRDRKSAKLSEAYNRPVWGDGMKPFEAMRDQLQRVSEPDLPDEVAARLKVRVQLLDALCGKRQGTGWAPVTIEAKRDFAERYVEFAALIVPRLKVRASTDGPKALTRIFDGLNVPADFPCSVALRHEFGSGAGLKYANLLISGAARRTTALRAQSGLLDPIGAEAVEAGKSLAVRLATPALVPEGERFEEQKEKVRAGLEAVGVLAEWFTTNRGALATLLGATETQKAPAPPFAASSEDPRSRSLQSDLERAMRALAREAEDQYKYRPGYFLDLLERYGAESTIHHLLAGEPSSGFAKLWELKALHLSVEALIGREPWASSGMFDEIELRRARQRLKQVGYVEG